jgi:rhodanese-related sulfurtransferase
MKSQWIIPLLCSLIGLAIFPPIAQADPLDEYVSSFTYQERKDMKINSKELVELLKQGKAQLIDIRFAEEFNAWHMGVAKNIPINELPRRLSELDAAKIIVTACPHKDRAAMARMYLAVKGYNAKYLTDGLVGLAEELRGDRAKAFVDSMAN